jgi:YHS domain-containing protein
MYPTKPQPTTPTSEARNSRFKSAALVACKLSLGLVFLCAACAPGVSQESRTVKKPTLNLDQNGVILKGYDPVAYFKQGQAIKGDPKYSSTYQGAIYYFASPADKRTFDKHPAKYKPQYGGFCAHGMSEGKLSDIDPNEFLIYKGKLYVCTGPVQIKALKANPENTIKKADKNWQRYQPPEIPGYLGRVHGSDPTFDA